MTPIWDIASQKPCANSVGQPFQDRRRAGRHEVLRHPMDSTVLSQRASLAMLGQAWARIVVGLYPSPIRAPAYPANSIRPACSLTSSRQCYWRCWSRLKSAGLSCRTWTRALTTRRCTTRSPSLGTSCPARSPWTMRVSPRATASSTLKRRSLLRLLLRR